MTLDEEHAQYLLDVAEARQTITRWHAALDAVEMVIPDNAVVNYRGDVTYTTRGQRTTLLGLLR